MHAPKIAVALTELNTEKLFEELQGHIADYSIKGRLVVYYIYGRKTKFTRSNRPYRFTRKTAKRIGDNADKTPKYVLEKLGIEKGYCAVKVVINRCPNYIFNRTTASGLFVVGHNSLSLDEKLNIVEISKEREYADVSIFEDTDLANRLWDREFTSLCNICNSEIKSPSWKIRKYLSRRFYEFR